jgi:hypothetical protein
MPESAHILVVGALPEGFPDWRADPRFLFINKAENALDENIPPSIRIAFIQRAVPVVREQLCKKLERIHPSMRIESIQLPQTIGESVEQYLKQHYGEDPRLVPATPAPALAPISTSAPMPTIAAPTHREENMEKVQHGTLTGFVRKHLTGQDSASEERARLMKIARTEGFQINSEGSLYQAILTERRKKGYPTARKTKKAQKVVHASKKSAQKEGVEKSSDVLTEIDEIMSRITALRKGIVDAIQRESESAIQRLRENVTNALKGS